MNKVLTYENGLQLIVAPNTSVRSVATGIWVKAGSSNEQQNINGISHFTEHVMFKGTNQYDSYQIANAFESIGALINAFTGKEATCYYVKSIDEYTEECFKLISHIFTCSQFDPQELDKERNVIVEEINMVEDSPEDICYDLLAETLYKGHTLGQTILGPVSNVKRFKREDVISYMDSRYNADNIVVSVSGNITYEQADKLVRKYLLNQLRSAKTIDIPVEKINVIGGLSVKYKDFEQSNIGISYPSIEFHSPLTPVQSVLSTLLGGGMSSRLFQRIRERMGLAYSVYSTPVAYLNNGNFNIMLNITPANTAKAVKAVKAEIDDIVKNGITEEECEKAKVQLKSVLVYSEENIQNIMTSQGKLLLLKGDIYSVDERIKEIGRVTKDDVNSYVREIFSQDSVCAAYVGKDPKVDIMDILKG